MSKPFVMFGYSHLFGDIVDCIESVDGQLEIVVLNMDEETRPGRATLRERIARLDAPVQVVQLNNFMIDGDHRYRFGNRCVIGFSRKQAVPLISKIELSLCLLGNPVIHKTAILQKGVKIEPWSIVNAGAILGSWSYIGRHVIVNRGASVGHDCVVRDHCFLSPSVVLCSHVRLGENVLVGANATILPDVEVGDGATIAAGAVVLDDVPAGAMVAGVPGVIMKVSRADL